MNLIYTPKIENTKEKTHILPIQDINMINQQRQNKIRSVPESMMKNQRNALDLVHGIQSSKPLIFLVLLFLKLG